MKTYADLYQLFPSKKLTRRILPKKPRLDTKSINHVRLQVQASLLAAIEESTLQERIYLVLDGECKLNPYLGDDGKYYALTFIETAKGRRALKALAVELHRWAKVGIDVCGKGTIVCEGTDVVFVPKPPPDYGNIILLDWYAHSRTPQFSKPFFS